MGLRPGSQSPDCLVKSHIGSAYDNVMTIVENLENVNDVADNIEDIKVVSNNSSNIQTITDNLDDVVNVSDNMSDVTIVAENIAYIRDGSFNFVQEELPVSDEMPVGAIWYIPSTDQVFVHYVKDLSSSGVWTETSVGN